MLTKTGTSQQWAFVEFHTPTGTGVPYSTFIPPDEYSIASRLSTRTLASSELKDALPSDGIA